MYESTEHSLVWIIVRSITHWILGKAVTGCERGTPEGTFHYKSQQQFSEHSNYISHQMLLSLTPYSSVLSPQSSLHQHRPISLSHIMAHSRAQKSHFQALAFTNHFLTAHSKLHFTCRLFIGWMGNHLLDLLWLQRVAQWILDARYSSGVSRVGNHGRFVLYCGAIWEYI